MKSSARESISNACLFWIGSVHEKFGVWTGPKEQKMRTFEK